CPDDELFADSPVGAGDVADMDLSFDSDEGDIGVDFNLDSDGGDMLDLDLGDANYDSDAPTMETPTVDLPGADAPTMETPTLEVPTGDSPTMETPTLEVPTGELPTMEMTRKDKALSDGDDIELDPEALQDLPAEFDIGEVEAPDNAADSGSGELDLDISEAEDAAGEDQPGLSASSGVDFDLGDLEQALDAPTGGVGDTVEQPEINAGDTAEQPALDTGLDLDASAPQDNSAELADDSSLRPDPGMPDDATMTEVGTKLDLARAYIDMGDPDGARSILDEVLEEGDEAQAQEARQLLQDLSD
ncbi:MAG: FimV/HubP family polar landmark protein, partial [Gammaproteobacteria bacterium]